jgi:4-amino-4-deoxy-L-arabinose transferase-like glycosyltransferase
VDRASPDRPPESNRDVIDIVVALLAVWAVLYLPWLAVEPPVAGLETTRILVSREMLRSGDWILPTQNGVPYLAKPPLGYWLFMLGSLPFGGVSVVSTRLVSTLCMLATALAVALFARRALRTRAAQLAGVCVLGMGLCLQKGLHAEIEAPFMLFTTLAILAAFRAAWSERRSGRWTVASGVALGAALLVKGPLALLAFVLALAAMAIGSRSVRDRVLERGTMALFLGVVIGAAWLAALGLHGTDAAQLHRLVDEVVERIHHAGRTNIEPWWYYAAALPAAMLPATFLLPTLVARRSPAAVGDERQRSLFALLLGWSAMTVVVMSFSSGKESRYLMVTLPGWSLLAAWGWYRSEAAPWHLAWRRIVVRAGLFCAWVLPIAWALLTWKLRPSAWGASLAAGGLSILGLTLLLRGRRTARPWMLWSALLLEMLALRVYWAAVPMANENEQYPVQAMGAEIAAHLAPGQPLVQLGEYTSTVQLQVDHPIRPARGIADIRTEMVLEPHTPYLLARTRYLSPGDEGGFIEVASWPFGAERYRLLRVR